MGALTDFAGGQNLHFFRIVPDFVDKKKKPGYSAIPKPTAASWFINALTLRHIWASPNLIWSLIALAFYFLFPYDLSPTSVAAKGPLTREFFEQRFPIWFAVTFGYVGFWYATLYILGWAERSFIPNRPTNLAKLAHDMFYNFCAVVIWIGFENVFAFLWASGRLSYLSDSDAFSSPKGIARFVIGLILTPLWREVHFYFAHRLLHFKPIYTLVHSLHHRNTDIEPFSGLAMHPVEHLYYYSCILPSIFFYASPFHFVWNGIHLLLSPAASHSGWEDHFQADNFHYMHHRYFECNYAGTGAGAVDVFFGSFRDQFVEKGDDAVKPRPDPKSTLLGLPSLEFVAYLLLSAACVGVWAVAAVYGPGALGLSSAHTSALALLAGAGPVLLAYLFALVRFGPISFIEPFQNKPLWQSVFHFTMGNLVCALPIYAACRLAL